MSPDTSGRQQQRRGLRSAVVTRLLQWEFVLLLIVVLVFVVNSNLSPYFLDLGNLLDATSNFMEKAIVALPMTLVILCGDIDISVASIIALASVFMGMVSTAGGSVIEIILIGLAVGALAGLLNGFLITRFNIPAIAVTIGSFSLFRGIAYVILGDQAYTKYPKAFAYFGQGYLGSSPIPFELPLFVLLAAVFALILRRTTFGRRIYSVGNNATAARFSGVNVARIRLIVFTLNGLFSGIASVLLTSRIGSTRPNIAEGWELEIITTVVLGGVAITGGKGNIWGVIIGIFLLGFLQFGMGLINVPGKVMNIVTGFMLIFAIMLPGFLRQMRLRLRSEEGAAAG